MADDEGMRPGDPVKVEKLRWIGDILTGQAERVLIDATVCPAPRGQVVVAYADGTREAFMRGGDCPVFPTHV